MPSRVRLGLIGCGGIMNAHVRQLAPVRAARIEALADPSKASIARLIERHPQLDGLPVFADYQEMLEATELDGVIIASPHTVHYEQIMTCLDRRLHVLVEKPMVCQVDHAKEVIRKARQKRRILMLAYQRHYSPAFRKAREIVSSGAIGRVTYVAGLQAQEWLRATRGTWRQDPALSGGGQLNDSGSHLLDIVLWVTGLTPDTVYAEIDNRGTKVDILSSLSVRFKGGAICNLAIVGDAPTWWEDVTYYGEEGALYIRNDELTLQQTKPKARSTKPRGSGRARGNPDRNFVNSILGKEEPQTPPIWGLRVIQLTEAAWESARTGKVAKVKQ